jgi:hypothetical protein
MQVAMMQIGPVGMPMHEQLVRVDMRVLAVHRWVVRMLVMSIRVVMFVLM